MGNSQLHRIEECLSEDWLDAWAADVVCEVESYLRKHADFHAFLEEND